MNALAPIAEPLEAVLARRMARVGARVTGTGATALVVAHDAHPDRVVKLGFSPTDPWPIYAQWCDPANQPRPPSPHLPVIFEFHALGGAERPQGYVAVVERLFPCERAKAWTWTCERGRRRKHPPIVFADLAEPTDPGLADVVRRLLRQFPMARWDLAASNVMQRADGTAVLTDPWM